jgi:hypothetical protein
MPNKELEAGDNVSSVEQFIALDQIANWPIRMMHQSTRKKMQNMRYVYVIVDNLLN